MNSTDLTSFAAVMFALRAVVALMVEHKVPSAVTLADHVDSFACGIAFGRRSAALSIRNLLANRTAVDCYKPAGKGETALLTLAVELVKVGETFPVVPYYVGKGYRNGVAIAA